MKNENGFLNEWKIKTDEKKMNKTFSQPRVMYQSKQYFFTTERYVLTKTPHVHL
jgi:hypothetical protein